MHAQRRLDQRNFRELPSSIKEFYLRQVNVDRTHKKRFALPAVAGRTISLPSFPAVSARPGSPRSTEISLRNSIEISFATPCDTPFRSGPPMLLRGDGPATAVRIFIGGAPDSLKEPADKAQVSTCVQSGPGRCTFQVYVRTLYICSRPAPELCCLRRGHACYSAPAQAEHLPDIYTSRAYM